MKKINLIFRLLAGGYLIYIGITMLMQFYNQQEYSIYATRLIVLAGVFIVVGALAIMLPVIFGIRNIRKTRVVIKDEKDELEDTAPMPQVQIIEPRTGVISSDNTKMPDVEIQSTEKKKSKQKAPFRRKGNIEIIK